MPADVVHALGFAEQTRVFLVQTKAKDASLRDNALSLLRARGDVWAQQNASIKPQLDNILDETIALASIGPSPIRPSPNGWSPSRSMSPAQRKPSRG